MLCHHLGDHGTTPDGRLFRGARGGILSESVYGRIWHAARRAALGPDRAGNSARVLHEVYMHCTDAPGRRIARTATDTVRRSA